MSGSVLFLGVCGFFTGKLVGVWSSFSFLCSLSFSCFKASLWISCSEHCLFSLLSSSLRLCLPSSDAVFLAWSAAITGLCDSISLFNFLISFCAFWSCIFCSLALPFSSVRSACSFLFLSFIFETLKSSSEIRLSFSWIIPLSFCIVCSNASCVCLLFEIAFLRSPSKLVFAFSKTRTFASLSVIAFLWSCTPPLNCDISFIRLS